ncbi:MAG: hypothetical protein P8J32_01295 [bacterium]|nr:hypothetical protein [bacterium]
MTRYFLTAADGRRFLLSTADDEIITEVGTSIFSLRGRPISSYYDRQYKLDSTGEVIVVKNATTVAVLADFDPDFEIGAECDLQDVLVKDADGQNRLLFMEAGGGILNVGTEVFEDPCGNTAAADGVYFLGRYELTVSEGAVAAVEESETDDPTGALVAYVVMTTITEKETKAKVFVKKKTDIIEKGAEVFADSKGEKLTDLKEYTFKDYVVTLEKGKISDVSKGDIKDPRTK